MIGRLNHVAIAVPDLAAASGLYRDTLGATVTDPVPIPEHGVTTVFVELPNTKIELLHPLGEDSPIAKFLERNPGGQIIYDVKCTRFLDALIREHGGQPLMWKTGHSFIKAKIQESGALLAGEMSGHIFIKERWYGFDDGLYAAARLLEILGKDSRPSAEVFAELPDSVNTPELNVQMREGEPPVFMNSLLEHAHFEDATVSTIDGLRADFPDGWGLVRASNTTPVLVLRFEADNDEALARIMGEFRRVMQQVDADLSLPF